LRTRDYKYDSVQQTDDKRPHERPTQDVNIKINLKEIMCEEVGLIHVIDDRVHWRALVENVMNLCIPQKEKNFSTCSEPLSIQK
jgi:hypothetical protein